MSDLKTNAHAPGPDLIKNSKAGPVVAEMKSSSHDAAPVAKTEATKVDTKAMHAAPEAKTQKLDLPELAYTKITKLEDIDALGISDQAKTNLKWLAKKLGFEEQPSSEKDFIRIQVNKEGKAMVDMAGERADKQYFKRGFLQTAFGWFTKLFTRIDRATGTKMVKNGSGINVADPANKEAKLEPQDRIFDSISSGRYSVSAHYDLNSDKYKEPEAIALYDQFGELLNQIKAKLPKDISEDQKNSILADIHKFEAEGLSKVCVCSTLLLRDDMREKYSGSEPQSAGQRNRLFAEFGVTNNPETTFIIPSDIFTSEFVQDNGHLFEKIHDLATIEMTESGPKEVAIPVAEVVRSPAAKKVPIPAADFAKVFSLHRMNEIISNPSQMTPELAKLLGDIEQKNKAAIEKFDASLNPKDTHAEGAAAPKEKAHA